MKKIKIVILLMIGFSYCISARDDCYRKMNVDGVDDRNCSIETILLMSSETIVTSRPEENEKVRLLLASLCLQHEIRRKECDNESNIVPQFLE